MLLHFAYSIVLIFGTVFIHAACTVAVLGWLHSVSARHWVLRNALTRTSVLAVLVFLLSAAVVLEASLWAGFYVWVGALPAFHEALYFSLVTFTTLGYGDVTLHETWQLLGALEAANGILMFGWTTALIVAVATRVFHREEDASRN